MEVQQRHQAEIEWEWLPGEPLTAANSAVLVVQLTEIDGPANTEDGCTGCLDGGDEALRRFLVHRVHELDGLVSQLEPICNTSTT